MIITLVKADFSANNIGTLSSFAVLPNILNATYNGPASVEKGGALNATITMQDGYDLGSIRVVMGGEVLTDVYSEVDGVITISIPSVSGVVTINLSGVKGLPDKLATPVIELFIPIKLATPVIELVEV